MVHKKPLLCNQQTQEKVAVVEIHIQGRATGGCAGGQRVLPPARGHGRHRQWHLADEGGAQAEPAAAVGPAVRGSLCRRP